MLLFTGFSSSVIFSCIAPFFPREAQMKGASVLEIGSIFGFFELVLIFACPIVGKFLPHLGFKFCYSVGLLIVSTNLIMFGFVDRVLDGKKFIALCFAIRIATALGEAAYTTAAFAIMALKFGKVLTTVTAIHASFIGCGAMVGPTIGGALYELGGFIAPFAVLGSMLFMCFLLSLFVVPNNIKSSQSKDLRGITGMARIPGVMIMMLAQVISSTTLNFQEPTLEPFLREFNLSPVQVGLVFFLATGTYAIMSPIWGQVIDRFHCLRFVVIVGACICTVSEFLLGPSPLSGLPKNLWLIRFCQVLTGTGLSATFVPTFRGILDASLTKGFPDEQSTFGLVAGIWGAVYHIGAFIGPTFGSASIELIGFAWTTSVLSLTNFLMAIILVSFTYWERRKENSSKSGYENIN